MLKVIEIHYDGQTQSLALADPNQQSLVLDRDADRVQWLVQGCPNDCLPRVEFVVDDQQPWGLGPFTTLRSNPSYVLSGGLRIPSQQSSASRSGSTRLDTFTFQYQVILLASNDDPLEPTLLVGEPLGGLELAVEASTGSTGLTVIVRPDLEDPASLTAEPDQLSVRTGDTVEWIFESIDDATSWLPRVEFFRSPVGSRQMNSHFGPFNSLTVEESRVIGAGYNGVLGRFGYLVQTVDATTGEPLRSKIKDPGLADDGDPPGGMGG